MAKNSLCVLALAAGATAFFGSSPAHGAECVAVGPRIAWASRCVTLGIQLDNVVAFGFSPAEVELALARSIQRWTTVDCGGGSRPSIQLVSVGALRCDHPEFNREAPNANTWMIVTDQWLHPAQDGQHLYGLTSVTTDDASGRILDADVEINFARIAQVPNPMAVLEWVATHEAGHFLGLGHTCASDAVMSAGFDPTAVTPTALSDDDVEAICSTYPPGRPALCDTRPENGFTRECAVDPAPACSASAERDAPFGLFLAALFGAAGLARRSPRTRR